MQSLFLNMVNYLFFARENVTSNNHAVGVCCLRDFITLCQINRSFRLIYGYANQLAQLLILSHIANHPSNSSLTFQSQPQMSRSSDSYQIHQFG